MQEPVISIDLRNGATLTLTVTYLDTEDTRYARL